MTKEEKNVVSQMRKDFDFKKELSDDEVLAEARFVENGSGMKFFNSVEEFKAWKKGQRHE